MMTVTDVMTRIKRAGATLRIDETGKLWVNAQRGAVGADLRSAIAAHKSELLALVALENCEAAYNAGDVAEAERWANELDRLGCELWAEIDNPLPCPSATGSGADV